MLPGTGGWRVPAWVVGERKAEGSRNGAAAAAGAGGATGRREFEGLRERMERERGEATGREGQGQADGGDATRRRGTLGGMLAGQFGGEG